MVNEIQVRHGNQLSNKSQEQLRRVNKALMYVVKELGAASRRLVTTARFLRQQIPAVGRRHSEKERKASHRWWEAASKETKLQTEREPLHTWHTK